jgi:hypothetical protein
MPALMLLAIIATGNHYLLDAAAGAIAVALGLGWALLLRHLVLSRIAAGRRVPEPVAWLLGVEPGLVVTPTAAPGPVRYVVPATIKAIKAWNGTPAGDSASERYALLRKSRAEHRRTLQMRTAGRVKAKARPGGPPCQHFSFGAEDRSTQVPRH